MEPMDQITEKVSRKKTETNFQSSHQLCNAASPKELVQTTEHRLYVEAVSKV
jgi:hypothetical protein